MARKYWALAAVVLCVDAESPAGQVLEPGSTPELPVETLSEESADRRKHATDSSFNVEFEGPCQNCIYRARLIGPALVAAPVHRSRGAVQSLRRWQYTVGPISLPVSGAYVLELNLLYVDTVDAMRNVALNDLVNTSLCLRACQSTTPMLVHTRFPNKN